MPSIAVVPAAGRSERFGSAKLLALVDGERLLHRTIRSLLDGGVDQVIVVLGADSPVRSSQFEVRSLREPGVRVVTNPDPSRGMFSWIQIGVAAAEGDPIL